MMSKDRDLLPWILGGLSMVAIAMAVAVGSASRTTPVHASSQSISPVPTAQLIPKPPTAPVPAGAAPASLVSAPTQSDIAAQAPPATAPGSQIWECTTNGVKTFSNSRCGNAAILRDVGPINVMDPSPVASNVHWYGSDSNDSPDYYYPDPPQAAGNSYPVVAWIPYLARRRPEHPHQPDNRDRVHPRRN